jgi:hypothetical protein
VSSCLPRIKRRRNSPSSYYADKEEVLFWRHGKDWFVREPNVKGTYQLETSLGKAGITDASFRTRKEAVEATCAALGLESISFRRSGSYGKWVTEDGFFFFDKEEENKTVIWYLDLTQSGVDHFQIESSDEDLWFKANGLQKEFPTMKAARQAIATLFPKKYTQAA